MRQFQIDRKTLERGRGFLIHLARTYPGMVPFLKGVHHTLEIWRGGRDVDGWKFDCEDWEGIIKELGDESLDWKTLSQEVQSQTGKEAPQRVTPVARLNDDLHSLLALFHLEKTHCALSEEAKLMTSSTCLEIHRAVVLERLGKRNKEVYILGLELGDWVHMAGPQIIESSET